MNARTRTIAIGDVHGCLDELEELLARVSYRFEEDRLVFVGDLVDRGPNPAGVVRRVKELASRGDVVLVQGNHEEKLLRWHRRVSAERAGGPKNLMRAPAPERLAQWEALDDSERAWLEACPPFASPAPGWLVVHAGFDATARERQKPSVMMRCRFFDATSGKMKALDDEGAGAPPGTVWWTERWASSGNVVYGHNVHSLERPRVDRNDAGGECWGIDTGCCFGGRLTALCLETREVFQVQARAKYAELRGALED